ncbi:hypothetical protein NIES267_73970 (plasmid) [Calothrix parasitica NIES-267]|uniref:Uncharacterized protein n=1 Tax=Calothrix parasitica NIES-267 TaxID=1973488 RepID=A0A1Z4M304_9CYAN|nr:hypothetical protein NIES267_73970 [Calothrix parasitica NIES-267]
MISQYLIEQIVLSEPELNESDVLEEIKKIENTKIGVFNKNNSIELFVDGFGRIQNMKFDKTRKYSEEEVKEIIENTIREFSRYLETYYGRNIDIFTTLELIIGNKLIM